MYNERLVYIGSIAGGIDDIQSQEDAYEYFDPQFIPA